jgi:hypothetical protein
MDPDFPRLKRVHTADARELPRASTYYQLPFPIRMSKIGVDPSFRFSRYRPHFHASLALALLPIGFRALKNRLRGRFWARIELNY